MLYKTLLVYNAEKENKRRRKRMNQNERKEEIGNSEMERK